MQTFTFKCYRSPDAPQMWIAECDELRTCTEAKTYEALVDRVWLIGPEMAVELGLVKSESDVKLRFVSEMSTPEVFESTG